MTERPTVDEEPGRVHARRAIGRIALELVPVVLVVSAVFFEMRHISRSLWSSILLYNGDSLVLPLLSQSMQRGEPFQWVFSSQSFFFPEYPIYWLCALVGQTPKIALVLNAFANVLILYGLLRGIAGFVAPGRRARQVVVALAATAVFIVFMLTENLQSVIAPGIVPQPYIATLFIISTYYYGVVLVGLATILLTLWVTRRFAFDGTVRTRLIAYLVVVYLMAAAITYADPLYLAQFVIPFGAAILLLALARRIPVRWMFVLLGIQAIAGVTGLVARNVLGQYIAFSVNAYVATGRDGQAFLVLLTVLKIWLLGTGPTGVLKVALLAITLAFALAYFIYFVPRLGRRSTPGRSRPRTVDTFVMSFIVAGAASLLAGQVLTGQELTRYLIPLFIFPLLGIVLLADDTSLGRFFVLPGAARVRRRLVTGIAMGLSLFAAALLLVIGVPPTVSMIRLTQAPGQACLENWLGSSTANGVGSFMITRPLKLYGTQKGQLLQVVPNLQVQAWMNNLASYRDTTFSYVLVDRSTVTKPIVLQTLGNPSSVTSCRAFDIYDYAGTTGQSTLTQLVRTSLNQNLVARGYSPDR
jgi:hypothetical protein